MSDATRDRIRRIVYDGIELPCRAIVRKSEATPQFYRATVEVIDGSDKPTGQVLEDLTLDHLWLISNGNGVFAPPEVDQVVLVVWVGDSAGGPVIASYASKEPATPRLAVPAGEWSLQGQKHDMRMKDDEWSVEEDSGAVISGKNNRWKIAADEDLLAVINAFVDAVIGAMTAPGVTTDAAGHTGPIPPLALDPGTIAALNVIKQRLAMVLRT